MSPNTATMSSGLGNQIKEYGVGIALAGYIAGFVVTSLYLGQYKVVNFDILRARYVLTGSLFLMFAFTCLFPAYVSWRALTRQFTHELTKEPKKRKFPLKRLGRILFIPLIGNIFSVVAIGLPLYFIINLTTPLTLVELPYRFSYVSSCIFLMYSLFVLFAYVFIAILLHLPARLLAYFSSKAPQDPSASDSDLYFNFMVGPTVGALLLLVIVFAYSYFVYPAMPQQLGGGKPIAVEVTYQDGNQETLEILDRTASTIIFLKKECPGNTKRAVEVASDALQSLSPVSGQPQQCP